MTNVDSAPVVADSLLDSSILQRPWLLPDLPPRDSLLIEQEQDVANYTGQISSNGTSNRRLVNPAHILESSLLHYKSIYKAEDQFRVLQKWQGYVIEVGEETFWARLVTLVGKEPDQEAEIYLAEVQEYDRDWVEPGAVFYWSIGSSIKPSGTLMHASIIRFRRLPPWTKGELTVAQGRAERIMDLLGVR